LGVHQKSDKKDVRLAVATVLFNYAVYFGTEEDVQNKYTSEMVKCSSTILAFLSGEQDEEILFRLLCALGTLAIQKKSNSKNCSRCIKKVW